MISIGPFTLAATEHLKLSGVNHQRWWIEYAGDRIAYQVLPEDAKQSEIVAAFAEDIAQWCDDLRDLPVAPAPESGAYLKLLDEATGEVLSTMPWAAEVAGLRNAIPDDRSPTWLVTSTAPSMAMPMAQEEFSRLRPAMVALHNERIERAEELRRIEEAKRPTRYWITKLLPGDLLTEDPSEWRHPTSWEIRHIVGEGSLTGISGAMAADLVGVLPPSFRKYTAADGAKTRQNMGFAMWHHLLHRLDIQRPSVWGGK